MKKLLWEGVWVPWRRRETWLQVLRPTQGKGQRAKGRAGVRPLPASADPLRPACLLPCPAPFKSSWGVGAQAPASGTRQRPTGQVCWPTWPPALSSLQLKETLISGAALGRNHSPVSAAEWVTPLTTLPRAPALLVPTTPPGPLCGSRGALPQDGAFLVQQVPEASGFWGQ